MVTACMTERGAIRYSVVIPVANINQRPLRPTREQIQSATGKHLKDVIAPNLQVLFCGINPSLYSAAVGHNFARPGNRFWPALFGAGFTDRLLSPSEEQELLHYGCGITNIAARATARAEELTREELITGAQMLSRKVGRHRPQYLAIVGVTAYRIAFHAPRAVLGLQETMIEQTRIWVLPNTSGLNAHYQMSDLIGHFKRLRRHISKVHRK
jgi:TDG/mug DNA glycosylase family protein